MDYPDYRASADPMAFRPRLFRINQAEDAEGFNLLVGDPDLMIHDTIQLQLVELLKIRQPNTPLHESDLNNLIQAHIGDFGLHEYGTWVWYPWCKRLVHLLDEKEFIEVRTARNKYKITAQEQAHLATKHIGIVGLSVGSAVAYTIALERGCGLLKLADFDTIDLSNLNRIRASIHDIGLHKAVLMAREIAELDPYIKVEIYTEGLTSSNMGEFLGGDYPLDLLIDECDSLEMKLEMRHAARSRGIPVIMETSDRGMLDIERFDIEADRPLFHGKIEALLAQYPPASWTPALKMQYLTSIVDVAQVSDRMKYSYSELGKSIATWPQLASDVFAGGGHVAATARRILLGEMVESGRYYIDLQELIGGNVQ